METSNRPVSHLSRVGGHGPHNGGTAAAPRAADWQNWIRLLERKRRALGVSESGHRKVSPGFFARLTVSSFRLEGLPVNEEQVTSALSHATGHRPVRSRLAQRIRNHVAILRGIQRWLANHQPLKSIAVIRWYTSVSCGLSTTALDESTMERLDEIVNRINSPPLRLPWAMQDVATLHARLMREPLTPSFNGILARLLLGYHLGRCGLSPVAFDLEIDGPILTDPARLLKRLMELIDAGFSAMVAGV
jgi:hypothetical protein